MTDATDLTSWEFWWAFNKDRYLNLKAAIYAQIETGSPEFFLNTSPKGSAKETLRPSEADVRGRIVPALRAALEGERSNDVVTGCLVALARIGDVRSESGASELAPLVARFLSDGNQEIAETAAVAMGILSDEGSVGTLASLARDDAEGRRRIGRAEVPFRTRAFAAYGLGLIGHRTARDAVRQDVAGILAGLLGRPEGSTRDLQVAALVGLGLVPVEFETGEIPAARRDPASSREAELAFVEGIFSDAGRAPLLRAHAPGAMARLLAGAPAPLKEAVAQRLVAALAKGSPERPEVQQGCVLALGQVGDADDNPVDASVRETLIRVLAESRDDQTRSFALIALGQVGGRSGRPGANESGTRDCRNELLATLTRGRTKLRPWAAIGIGVMEREIVDGEAGEAGRSVGAESAVRSALREAGAPKDVAAYAIACGIAKDPDARSILREKLGSTNEDDVRGYVAVALGLAGARDALGDIQRIVKESRFRPALLKQAAIGLGLLGDKALVGDLVAMLGQAQGLSAQAAVASALGFIGDSRSIDPLVEMLRRREITSAARGFAAVALGIVADKEPLPWNSRISENLQYRASTSTLTSPEGTGILDIL